MWYVRIATSVGFDSYPKGFQKFGGGGGWRFTVTELVMYDTGLQDDNLPCHDIDIHRSFKIQVPPT